MTPILCPQCLGLGSLELRTTYPHLARVLDVLERAGETTAAEVQAELGGVGVTAMSNRLERLRGLGMVERTKRGRAWRYRLK